jgi:outer membrane protein TolC
VKFFVGVAACLCAGIVVTSNPSCAQAQLETIRAQAGLSGESQARTALRAAVDAAWERATGSRESASMRGRAEADLYASRRLWAAAPSLELSHRDDRLQSSAGKRESEAAIAWPMWLPGQRAANEVMAQAGVDRAQATERAARWQVAGAVRDSAWRLIAQASEHVQVQRQVEVLQRLYEDVDKRVQAGDLARADALAARAEWLEAQSRLADISQRVDEARLRWRELTGLSLEPERQSLSERLSATNSRDDHPELEAALRNVEHARRRLDLTRASTREPPELKLGVRQDVSGGVEGAHNSIQVGVRIPFGTADRNRPLEAAAVGDLAVAEAVEQRLRQRLQADVAAARSAVGSAQQQLGVEQQRTKLLQERAALIERSFRAGESALPDLLRAMASAFQAEAAVLRQDIALDYAHARLQQALGVLP